jgi:hypothetical protein
MSSNQKAYVAIPMNDIVSSDNEDEAPTTTTITRSKREPNRNDCVMIPKLLFIGVVVSLILVMAVLVKARHGGCGMRMRGSWVMMVHRSPHPYGWNQVTHDSTTYGEDIVVLHLKDDFSTDESDNDDDIVFEEEQEGTNMIDDKVYGKEYHEEDTAAVMIMDAPSDFTTDSQDIVVFADEGSSLVDDEVVVEAVWYAEENDIPIDHDELDEIQEGDMLESIDDEEEEHVYEAVDIPLQFFTDSNEENVVDEIVNEWKDDATQQDNQGN